MEGITDFTVDQLGGSGTFKFPETKVYKYSEAKSIAAIAAYIDSTYSEHYISKDDKGIQCFDLWEALDTDPTDTHRNTALKYLYRYGKKHGHNKNDLFKAIHYILMLMHYHEKHHVKKVEKIPQ